MARSRTGVYIATGSGVTEIDGVPHVFARGVTLVREGHKLLDACPDCFEPVSDHVHYDVEAASSAPGEKRGE